ncbi:MAG: glutamyl-tRNA reductase [Candidatus Brocadiae bacterium]|nr:glutamyl-tRNA reductase [Candidatus Brocadiia bacterium]
MSGPIQVIGVSHHKAPVDLREKVSVPAGETTGFLSRLITPPMVREALLISTCNRVEAWMTGEPDAAGRRAVDLIAAHGGLAPSALQPFIYDLRDEQAVTHLFRVASSLDSMVLGETQILSQVKEAYRVAKEAGATGRTFNLLFQKAIHVAKRVHTETRISDGKLSVSSVAVDLAAKVFRDLGEKAALVLGAGEMGELTALCLRERGVSRITIANRSRERGAALAARLGAVSVDLDRLEGALAEIDILVACAAGDAPLLTGDLLNRSMGARGGRPMFIIDIGVPRNVDAAADGIPDLYIYNIDDLQAVVARNLASRMEKVEAGSRLVADEARDWLRRLSEFRA